MIHCFLYLLLDYLFLFALLFDCGAVLALDPCVQNSEKNFFLHSSELMLSSDSPPKQTVDFLFSASSYCHWRLRGNDDFNFPILGRK